MDWIKKIMPADVPEYWSTLGLWVFGALIVLAAVTPGQGSIFGNRRQATDSLVEKRFKITMPSFNVIRTTPQTALSGPMDREISLLGQDAVSDGTEAGSYSLRYPELPAVITNGEKPPSTVNQNGGQTMDLKGASSFLPIIHRAASQYQIDPHLVRAIIFAESGYNPRAVSRKGAKGLMQLMPATAKAMGVEDSFNPEHNIFGGVKYFKKLFNQFDGDVTLALAAYNAGSRNVREFNGVPPFETTRHYIQKVLKYYEIYKNQQTEPVELT